MLRGRLCHVVPFPFTVTVGRALDDARATSSGSVGVGVASAAPNTANAAAAVEVFIVILRGRYGVEEVCLLRVRKCWGNLPHENGSKDKKVLARRLKRVRDRPKKELLRSGIRRGNNERVLVPIMQ